MKKLNFSEMVVNPDFDYHDFKRITASKSSNHIGYFLYILDKRITESTKRYYDNLYNNIKFIQVSLKYAPQILYSAIMVYDKVIK